MPRDLKLLLSLFLQCAILAEWNNLLINTIQGGGGGGRKIPSPLMLSELGKALA